MTIIIIYYLHICIFTNTNINIFYYKWDTFAASCFGDLTVYLGYLSMSACTDSLHSFDDCMPYAMCTRLTFPALIDMEVVSTF